MQDEMMVININGLQIHLVFYYFIMMHTIMKHYRGLNISIIQPLSQVRPLVNDVILSDCLAQQGLVKSERHSLSKHFFTHSTSNVHMYNISELCEE